MARSKSTNDLIQWLRRTHPQISIIALSGYSAPYLHDLYDLGIPVIDKASAAWSLISTVHAVLSRQVVNAHTPREALQLEDIQRAFSEEASKLLALKERTLTIPDEGTYELSKPLQGFKEDIERHLLQFPFQQNVFLMMKFRSTNRDIADYIIETLQHKGFRAVRADDREWNITNDVYNPIAVLYCCKYGIALFDEPEEYQSYSPNVAYELGIMHQQNKECLILKHASLPQVPFDIVKDLYMPYDRDLQLRRIIEHWIDAIAAQHK